MDLAFEKYPELWEYRMSHVERLEENLAELDEKFGPAVLKCFTRGNTIWLEGPATIHRATISLEVVALNLGHRVCPVALAAKMADVGYIKNVR